MQSGSEPQRLLADGYQTRFGERVAAGKKSYFVSLPYQFFCEIGDHTFGPTVELRRNTFIKRRNLGNSHRTAILSQHR